MVATGGVARFVVPLCRHEIALERDLQLKGLDLLYRKNRPRKEAAPDPPVKEKGDCRKSGFAAFLRKLQSTAPRV